MLEGDENARSVNWFTANPQKQEFCESGFLPAHSAQQKCPRGRKLQRREFGEMVKPAFVFGRQRFPCVCDVEKLIAPFFTSHEVCELAAFSREFLVFRRLAHPALLPCARRLDLVRLPSG